MCVCVCVCVLGGGGGGGGVAGVGGEGRQVLTYILDEGVHVPPNPSNPISESKKQFSILYSRPNGIGVTINNPPPPPHVVATLKKLPVFCLPFDSEIYEVTITGMTEIS